MHATWLAFALVWSIAAGWTTEPPGSDGAGNQTTTATTTLKGSHGAQQGQEAAVTSASDATTSAPSDGGETTTAAAEDAATSTFEAGTDPQGSSSSCQDAEGSVCPKGYFRSSPVVFACNTSSVQLKPGCWVVKSRSLNDIFELPVGVSDMNVGISMPSDMDLYLYSPKESKYLVQTQKGVANNSTRTGNFQNLQITYSGDGKNVEYFNLTGKTHDPLKARVESYGAEDSSAVVDFSYTALEPCPEVPVGCNQYDHATAQQEVLSWSKGISSRYSKCEDVWYHVVSHAVVKDLGIGWHKWATVWSQLDEGAEGGGSAESWQLGFAFLDDDRNGYINKEEFIMGCILYNTQQHLVGSSDPDAGKMSATGVSSGGQVGVASSAPVLPATTLAPQASTTVESVAAQCSDAVGCVKCPTGYYRTSALLFPCESTQASTCVILEPQQLSEVSRIPTGIGGLHINLKADVAADLSLYDPAANAYVVQKDTGTVSNSGRSATYQGMAVAFSGDDNDAPTSETIDIQGTTSTELYLRARNYDTSEAWALLEHSHDGVTQCNTVPKGCSAIDSDEAGKTLAGWTEAVRQKYGDPETAWEKLLPNAASTAVSWYQWKNLWNSVGAASAGQSMESTWQLGFAVLDQNADCVVSAEEFRHSFRQKLTLAGASGGGNSSNISGQSNSYLETSPTAAERASMEASVPSNEPAIQMKAEALSVTEGQEVESGPNWSMWFIMAAFAGCAAMIVCCTIPLCIHVRVHDRSSFSGVREHDGTGSDADIQSKDPLLQSGDLSAQAV